MGLDPLEPVEQRVAERVGIGKARELGNAIQLLRLGGNDVGLLVADHLQPVLDAAQKEIGLGEVLGGARSDPTPCGEALKRFDGTSRSELGMTAAGDQLLRLGEELNVADAAPPKLDVVPLHRDGAVALEGVNPALHGMDVGHRREVEIFAPDEG